MKRMQVRGRTLAMCMALLAAGSWAGSAAAALSCATIRIVEPYPPGGSTGVIARMVADRMSKETGIPAIVENRPGASGNIGSAYVARAKPDGCTFLIGTDATHVGNYYLFKNFPYHPINDFAPITIAAKNLLVLVAHPSFAPNTAEEVIAYAKSKPGTVFYGSSGIGSPHHLAGEMFAQMGKVEMRHLPYNGSGPALADVLGGQIPLVFASLAPAMPHIAAGKLKAIGLTQKEPFAKLPGVPSIDKTLPGYEMSSWLAFLAPAGTPKETIALLHASITRTLKQPEAAAMLNDLGIQVVANSPGQFAAQLKSEFEQRGQWIRANNIEAQ